MNYLQKYQKQLGLESDGIIGPKTAKAMMLDLDIKDKLVFIHLMGQMAHESQSFNKARENLNYSEAGLLNIFRKYYANMPALVKVHANRPEAIANYVYANRNGNGNENSGDGWRYRGIFGLQLTGKSNITKFMNYVGLDENMNPELLLSNPRNYFLAGKFWFVDNNVDALCTAMNNKTIIAVSKKVNGGINGLEDRLYQTKKLHNALEALV